MILFSIFCLLLFRDHVYFKAQTLQSRDQLKRVSWIFNTTYYLRKISCPKFFILQPIYSHNKFYDLYVISWSHTTNFSSCISLIITKNELRAQYAQRTQFWFYTVWLSLIGFSILFGLGSYLVWFWVLFIISCW